MKRSLILLTTGALGAALAYAGAGAQVLKNHDSNAPVNFNADRIEVQDRADRVVVSGNVEVTQAGMKLNAARMTVAYRNGTGDSGVEIDRIDASGNVVVTKGSETARGNVAIYDLNRRLITMLGNVSLTQGSNRLTGGRLVIDLTSGRSTVDGRASGGASGVSGGSGGRVSGTFTVPQRSN
ncbi:Lipopolysaccharide transport periplasmic protein LptA precursor [Sphingobium herbicidovorans NBRC 16415]|uniref:Lipopolysaccharide transport periplasmic protein LptA n=1 Tax=Sphingobium herbicidovorans (strain ATCC 700291 / DSM 11019 / CCUG 56400 / KCTC 2939 / LMG 18315 / NBRC 16415 / MH) TaxID=1219045 RepID=A0A086PB87_SPHHM|nr:LptA/OstA family protein [Sphingobium herbicidovorans]KFG90655.1 Lipopolysaccharide transport periplasmic protein LptA precursor [Sphingobium herbicidovorans NBRC 16415]